MNNPGRYLVSLPPINGADAVSGSPYFTANPRRSLQSLGYFGDARLEAHTVHHVPLEYGYRHASVPYFSGPGGITCPGGNTGTPATRVTDWALDLRKDEASIRLTIMVKF